MNWRQEQQALEDAFVRQLLIKYNIKDVTTQRQAKNGTREFEFPVPAYTKQRLKWFEEKRGSTWWKDLPRLRIACFESGYVRKQNGGDRAYQLNKTYNQNRRHTFLTEEGLVTKEYIGIARALIYTQLARLNYMLEYYLKNYKHNTKQVG